MIHQDNEAAIKLCENGLASSKRSRHIDIRYFFIQDRVKAGDIQIQYLSTKDMIADFLTKPLIGQQFYKLRDLLLGYTTLWGGCTIIWLHCAQLLLQKMEFAINT